MNFYIPIECFYLFLVLLVSFFIIWFILKLIFAIEELQDDIEKINLELPDIKISIEELEKINRK